MGKIFIEELPNGALDSGKLYFTDDTPIVRTKQTNADRIRAMSDEELAGFLDEFDSVSGCDMCSVRGNCHTASNCIEGFLGWLKSEVKE